MVYREVRYDLLIIDDDESVVSELTALADKYSWSYLLAKNTSKAIEFIENHQFRVVLSELESSSISGLELLEWIKGQALSPEVIIVTRHQKAETAIKALKLGAFDYVTKPFDVLDKVIFCIRHAIEKFNLTMRMHELAKPDQQGEFSTIIGKSNKMQAVFELVRNIAASDTNVLITGESGTGKELIAHAIHDRGERKDKAFIVINCAAMPETLLESELFGYVKGAFTGASQDKEGLFKVASSGTVFLDEIGEISLSTQVKLLRVLQEGEIRPLGSTESITVDVRIVAATNKDLSEQVKLGLFREDLFYRLNVINIQLPPLRERSEDILLLSYYFLKKMRKRLHKEVKSISLDAIQAMQAYSWPGNVRELENVIERAMVLCDENTITAKMLPPKILSKFFYSAPTDEEDMTTLSYKEAKKRALNIFNRSYIMGLLEKTSGNITQASELAGMDRSNFKKILRKYKISQNQ